MFSFSVVAGFVIFTSYVSGFALCWTLLRSKRRHSFGLQRIASFYHEHTSSGIKHAESSNGLLVSEELNDSLEHVSQLH